MIYENEMDYKKIGASIRKLRIQKGIAQIELAKEIGISQTHMSNIENGNTGISLWTAVKISRILDCSIDEFANEKSSKEQCISHECYMIDIDDLSEVLKLVAVKSYKKKDED